MKCTLRAVVIVFLAGYLSEEIAFGTASQLCSGQSPKDPAKYSSYVQKVLSYLVEKTPDSSTNSFRSWYPNQKPKSVSGSATCYTTDPAACRTCLQSLKAQLDQCTQSTAGGYFASKCNMQFWQIGSI
ncbi:hypothetical protein LINGRAHAP2_LOCUS33728 [Linum grandiflorum]